MENTQHNKIKLYGNLKISVPFMILVAIAGLMYYSFNLYRFFKSPDAITQSVLGLVGLIVSVLLITKYIILVFKTRALNSEKLSDAEKLEAYFSRSANYWIIDGIISICGITGLLLMLIAQM